MGVIEVASFDELLDEIGDGNAVVEFGASWCGPCKRFRPHFEGFAASSGMKSIYVDIDLDPKFVESFSIQHVPQVFLFKDGVYLTTLDARTGPLLVKGVSEKL